jgi:hypothetical protein
MFNHIDVTLPKLDRETIDGIRYYKVPDDVRTTQTSFNHFYHKSFQ